MIVIEKASDISGNAVYIVRAGGVTTVGLNTKHLVELLKKLIKDGYQLTPDAKLIAVDVVGVDLQADLDFLS